MYRFKRVSQDYHFLSRGAPPDPAVLRPCFMYIYLSTAPLLSFASCYRQGKKSSSSRRRGGKEKSGGGHEPSPSSRRRGGSKGSRDTPDDSPITAGLGGGSSGNMEGWDRSSPGGDVNANVNANIEDEDEDDSYLFMGATAVSRFAIPRMQVVRRSKS